MADLFRKYSVQTPQRELVFEIDALAAVPLGGVGKCARSHCPSGAMRHLIVPGNSFTGETDGIERGVVSDNVHEIWEQEGRPHGEDLKHWLLAFQEIAASVETDGQSAKKPRSRKATTADTSGEAERRNEG